MKLKLVNYPRPRMDQMMVYAGDQYVKFVKGQVEELPEDIAVQVMAKWKGCFEIEKSARAPRNKMARAQGIK